MYFKHWLSGNIELVKSDVKGLIWFKFRKESFNFDEDVFFCVSYIPPENSPVYTNPNSELFNFDFF